MVSPYAQSQNNTGWMNNEHHAIYTNHHNVNSDPFFDPQSLEITNNEFKPVPLPDDDFEPFLEKFNDIDNMLSESLGFQELGIPGGYQQQEYFDANGYKAWPSETKKHSRKLSGSAIFGFLNAHSHQLSIPGVNITENTFKKMTDHEDIYSSNNNSGQNVTEVSSASFNSSSKETKSPKRAMSQSPDAHTDFIITGKSPEAFKFPSPDKKPSPQGISASRQPPNKQEHHRTLDFYDPRNPSNIHPNTYSVEYINRLQDISREQAFGATSMGLQKNSNYGGIPRQTISPQYQTSTVNSFYLVPQGAVLQKPFLGAPPTNLEYSSPEEIYSSPNSSPILPHNMFLSPQHHPPQGPDAQTPQKLKLPPAPRLEPAGLMTPTKYTIVAKNQDDLAEIYNGSGNNHNSNSNNSNLNLLETPKKQGTDNEQVFWTPILTSKGDPSSTKIIKDQLKRNVSPVRKETKITSTLPKGHLDQYFVGPDESQKFTCIYQDCGKQFSRISNTRAHIQTHLLDRPFVCSQCSKNFVRHHDLRRHEKSHQEFTFVCPCGKKFPRQDALKRHRIRKICCGGIDDDKPVSPDKKLVSKPLKKKGRPRKEDELQDGLKDKILEDLNNNPDLDFGYLGSSSQVSREVGDNNSSDFLVGKSGSVQNQLGDRRNYTQDVSSTTLDQFYYDDFDLQV